MKLDHTVYKCSGCSLVRMFPSAIHAHCRLSLGCKDKIPEKYTFELDFPDHTESQSLSERRTPGPTPPNISHIFRGRIPAFDNDVNDDDLIFTRRIEYLFNTDGLIDTCMEASVNDKVPAYILYFFRALWGDLAPKEFQSIIVHRGQVFEIRSVDDETGAIKKYDSYPTIRKYFTEGNFLTNFRVCIQLICTTYIPIKRPDLSGKAEHILEWIMKSTNDLTMQDVFDRNEKYDKQRKKCDIVVKRAARILDTLTNILKETKIPPFHKTLRN